MKKLFFCFVFHISYFIFTPAFAQNENFKPISKSKYEGASGFFDNLFKRTSKGEYHGLSWLTHKLFEGSDQSFHRIRNKEMNKFLSDASELGVMLGGSYYNGEFNPGKPFYKTLPAGGIIFRHNINHRWAWKFSGLYGRIHGSDAGSSNKFNQARGLSFKSRIIELSGQIEFNFLPFAIADKRNDFTPYIFCGLSGFNFKPTTTLNGEKLSLRKYGTEGQGVVAGKKQYPLYQLSFPFGIGIKKGMSHRMSIGIEWGMRRTFTDYLDDVSSKYPNPYLLYKEKGQTTAELSNPNFERDNSATSRKGFQRGDSKGKDWYSFAGIVMTLRMGHLNVCHLRD